MRNAESEQGPAVWRGRMAMVLFGVVATAFTTVAAATARGPGPDSPTVVHVIADDLGYNDLGFANGNLTHTPNINERLAEGVWLSHYHTYKVCSPSRASIMTGRYPWAIGYYDMAGPEMVGLDYTMLPAVLSANGWATHALGKWNLGATTKAYTPTYRGFDSFVGYYNAALGDYWYHGGQAAGCPKTGTAAVTDLSNSSGAGDPTGVRPAPDRLNGTYDQEIFAAEAVRIIEQHASGGLYIYLAFQNVHTTAQDKDSLSGQQPFQAPCDTVDDHYATTAQDSYKVLGAMVTELDFGVGNVTKALQAAGRPWLMILNADNGGPINLGNTNFPLRGGKHTFWDGGVRVVALVSGPLVPRHRWGTRWGGLAHSSDWYLTIAEGIANISVGDSTGPRPFDGHNLWRAIVRNETSPRTEVIHQVKNNYTLMANLPPLQVIRMGRFKLILGDPGDSRVHRWPAPAAVPVPFGRSNGTRDGYLFEDNRLHCRSPADKTDSPTGSCRGPGCLFDLEADESESNNLINSTAHAGVVKALTARLAEAGASGPPWAWPYDGGVLKNLTAAICAASASSGYYEPVVAHGPPIGPSPPPPTPIWKPCIKALEAHCPYSKPPNYAKCVVCGSTVCDRAVTVEKYCHRG